MANFYQEVLPRIEQLPGVESASAVNFPPLSLMNTIVSFRIEGRKPPSPNAVLRGFCSVIGPQYFRTMEIPLLSGREFTGLDVDEARGVAIISASMARRFWPDSDPIGRQMRLQVPEQKYFWIPESKNLPLTIIGVAGDVRHDGMADRGNLPQFYLPYLQNPSSLMHLVVRTPSDPLSWANAVRNEVWAVDREQPVFDVKTIEEVVAESFARPRVIAYLTGAFAALAIVLATMGIYGLLSYSVSQRTHEIGIRMVLGARPNEIVKSIVRQGLKLTLVGVAIGLVVSFALTRVMASMLYGVSATDPVTFGMVALLLTAVAALASYVPARRAARVDPMVALRTE